MYILYIYKCIYTHAHIYIHMCIEVSTFILCMYTCSSFHCVGDLLRHFEMAAPNRYLFFAMPGFHVAGDSARRFSTR